MNNFTNTNQPTNQIETASRFDGHFRSVCVCVRRTSPVHKNEKVQKCTFFTSSLRCNAASIQFPLLFDASVRAAEPLWRTRKKETATKVNETDETKNSARKVCRISHDKAKNPNAVQRIPSHFIHAIPRFERCSLVIRVLVFLSWQIVQRNPAHTMHVLRLRSLRSR